MDSENSVQFEEDQELEMLTTRSLMRRSLRGMAAWLVRHKFAHTERQANLILIGIAIAAIAIMLIAILSTWHAPPSLTPAQRAVYDQMPNHAPEEQSI